MNRKLLRLWMLAWALLGGPAIINAEEAKGPKIGVSLSLSGPLSNYGDDVRKALSFANQLAGNRYELVFEDDRSSPREAAGIAHKFVSTDNIRYILGFVTSGSLLAAAPVYERGQALVIATLASSPSVSASGDFIFRTTPSDAVTGRALQVLLSARYEHVGIVSEETDYCEGLLRSIVDNSRFKSSVERFRGDNPDLRSLLLRLRAKGPRALVLNPQSDGSLIELTRQIKAIGWEVPMYGAYFPGSPSFLEAAGSWAEGMIFVDYPGVRESMRLEDVAVFEEFLQRYGALSTPDYVFIMAYNSFLALDQAIRSGKDPRSHLYASRFEGIGGTFSFDARGDVVGLAPVVKTIERGRAKIINR